MLAKVIAQNPEYESFSRFRELNVKTLLYYQVELSALQEELAVIEKRDFRTSTGGQTLEGAYAYSAESMLRAQCSPDATASQQSALVLKIRALLREYSETANPMCPSI